VNDSRGIETSPAPFSIFDMSRLGSSGTYYVRVFFDVYNQVGTPPRRRPCKVLPGTYATSQTVGTLNITLASTDNSCGIATPTPTQTYANYLMGTANYTSGTVDGNHPIVLRLFDNTNFYNAPVATAVVYSNGGRTSCRSTAPGRTTASPWNTR